MNKNVLCALVALWLVAGPAGAAPADPDFDGLRIGMSEAAFRKAHPKASCESNERDPVWDKTLSSVRTCRIDGYPLGEARPLISANSVLTVFHFYDDQLGGWGASFYEFHGRDLKAALAKRFGAGVDAPQMPGVTWKFGATTMVLYLMPDTSMVSVNSDIAMAWNQKRRDMERRKGKAED